MDARVIGAGLCVGVSIVSILAYLKRHGLFTKLKANKVKYGPYLVLYENHVGPYKDVGSAFKRLYQLTKEYKDGEHVTAGFYFDDPAKVPGDKCRASVGVIVERGLEDAELEEAKKLAEKHRLVTEEHLKVGIFPKSECTSVEFPLHGMLSLLIGIKRCYPLLGMDTDFGAGSVCSSLEIYDFDNHKMHITMPLTARNDLLPFEIKKSA